MIRFNFIVLALFTFLYSGCSEKKESIKPVYKSITSSIYASGTVKSLHQYEAFATVNGIVQDVFLEDGDLVKIGTPILSINNETQRLNNENAKLAAEFSDFNANQGKLNDAKLRMDLALNKMKNDSAMYFRQLNLFKQSIGTKVELEQKELNYENAKSLYYSSVVNYNDLKRQLKFNSEQAKRNLKISSKLQNDFILVSEVNGKVYSISKEKGEIVNTQTPLAILGDAKRFILEMQVDENDILKVNLNAKVFVTMDSYKGKVFEAKVTKVKPLMNEKSKTFLVEAVFINQPENIYPNLSFEANIEIETKNKALLIPRNYLVNETFVVKKDGTKVKVQTGLKDYEMVEILSGITVNDELILPEE